MSMPATFCRIVTCIAAASAMWTAPAVAQVASPAGAPVASPAPSPSPAPTPVPAYTLHGAFSLYTAHTSGVNATGALDAAGGVDVTDRTEISNALVTIGKNTTQLQGGVTVGAYAFPVVGQAIDPTTQAGANTRLYGTVPSAYLSYVPSAHLTVSAGQLATLLGQENGFTSQNVNIQRGIVWAAEPTFSRGVRATYSTGKFTGSVEYNDGFYSGGAGRAVEGLAGWAPSAATEFAVAFVVPGANTPGNPTASIANKREIDVMFTQTYGKLQLEPYVLFVTSPASGALKFASPENATGVSLIADYQIGSLYSAAFRFEAFGNASSTDASGANADLVGFGPGSSVQTWTITPAYRSNLFFARMELSGVAVKSLHPGLGFGADGRGTAQRRFLIESGVQF